MSPLAGLLLGLLLGPGARAQEENAGPDTLLTSAPDRRVELDFDHYYRFTELETALRDLAEAYPEFLRLESLGRSRGGRELWLVSINERSGGDPAAKPALFLAANLGREDLFGAEMALFTIARLAENHSRDPRVAEILAHTAIYVAPCLDPDSREEILSGREPSADQRVDLDRNFPVRWHPWSGGSGAGLYPLSEPESQAVAEFLLGRRNISIVVRIAGSPRPVPLGALADSADALPGQDLELFAALDGGVEGILRAGVRAPDAGERPHLGGGLLEFAYRQLGTFVFETVPWRQEAGDPAQPPADRLAELGRSSARSTLHLARQLPALVLREPTVRRLGESQWQVDLHVANGGKLPTLSATGCVQHACGPTRLRTEGPRVLAAALRRGDERDFRVVGRDPDDLELGQIEGGGGIDVRLVLEAPLGSELSLSVSSARAGSPVAEVALR